MAYTDRRRQTIGALLRRNAAHRRCWLRMDPDLGIPLPTRRITGLRRYLIIANTPQQIKSQDRFNTRWVSTGLHITRVRDIETGQEYDLPVMGNGTTVWVTYPKEAS